MEPVVKSTLTSTCLNSTCLNSTTASSITRVIGLESDLNTGFNLPEDEKVKINSSGAESELNKDLAATIWKSISLVPPITSNILKVPMVLNFSETCVQSSKQTTLLIKNLVNTWVRCLFTVREVIHEGQKINLRHSPFEMNRSVELRPSSKENVDVRFQPKEPGEFTALCEIEAIHLFRQGKSSTNLILFSAHAESPCLEITPANNKLNFGSLLWGDAAHNSIAVKNLGSAMVPLRFSIYCPKGAGSTLCNFSLDEADFPENVSKKSHKMDATQLSILLPGMKDSKTSVKTVNVCCRAKKNSHQAYGAKTEKIKAFLSMGIDLPDLISPLNDVMLEVTLGMYKLIVDKDMISILTKPGMTASGSVKIINSGNLPMPVDLSLEPIRDQFLLEKNHVVVPSGGCVSVKVAFTPKATQEVFENQVKIKIKNKMESIYVSVEGFISKQINIVGSPHYLHFFGVKVGKIKELIFTFYTDDDTDVKIWMRHSKSSFKLMNKDRCVVESIQLKATKGKQYSVYIQFNPTDVDGYSTDLFIHSTGTKFIVPVSGYGGLSRLKLSHVNHNQTGEWWMDVGEMVSDLSIFRNIEVTNTGQRACFIKAVLTDVAGNEFDPDRGSIIPPGVIILPGESYRLVVMLNPTQKEIKLCSAGRALVAILDVMYGDEVNRQLFMAHTGTAPDCFIDKFVLPMTSKRKEALVLEMKNVTYHGDNYSMIKKVLTKLSIGLFGLSQKAKHLSASKQVSRSYATSVTPSSHVKSSIQNAGSLITQESKAVVGTILSLDQKINTNAPPHRDFPPQSGAMTLYSEEQSERQQQICSGGVYLEDKFLTFQKTLKGSTTKRTVCLSNRTNKVAEFVVDYTPKPPFLFKLKNPSFQVKEHQKVCVVVEFKPRYVAQFIDKIVFREVLSGKTLTAFLDAESTQKSM